MKLRAPSELTIVLILTIFLTAPVFSALGYAWCVGDDGHSRLELVSVNGCSDGSVECSTANRMAAGTRIAAADKTHVPCFDYYIEKNAATLAKRFNKSPKVSIATSPTQTTASSYSLLPVDRLAVAQPPRVSQALLAHRTVVLLN